MRSLLSLPWPTTLAAIVVWSASNSDTTFAFVVPSSISQHPMMAQNSYNRNRQRYQTFLRNQHPARLDVDVIFGSGNPDDEEDEDYVQDRRLRTETVQRVLAEQDEEFRRERKQKQWGRFANATTREELEKIEAQERLAIARENEIKKKLAQSAGVILDLLEPVEKSVLQEDSNVQIQIGSPRGPKGWLTQVDEELEKEWEALVGNSGATSASEQGDDTDMPMDEDEEEDGPPDAISTATAMTKTGKIISRDALQGVRVGSAGGWTLEVFPGDFVVHRKYGIGRFVRTCLRPKTKLTKTEQEERDARRAEILTRKVRQLQSSRGVSGVAPEEIQAIRAKFGTEEDKDPISNPQTTVLEISYADGIVHVPVDRAYRLSRYRAGDAIVTPRLSRVKGEAWRRAKSKVEENTLLLAQDVLALYATRESLTRKPFDPAIEEQVKEFESTFPYAPTPDQLSCFEDVENDMVWRNRPMDRLICGDVGFGKTEVALRAIFRCVANGRQAALLAPTGVLAAQHFKNVMKRMGPDTKYGFNIAILRGGMGKTTKAGKSTRQQIENGEVNLIVGTHALLSNDLKFKDLGILVVDEEQRFGVKQKERLKLICDGIDVLTLSATPIPRTLQMSLSGIRDTSTIRSPPPMRKPTVTVVQEFSEETVRDAISRELARGGQCYYVVPRISMLDEAEELINKLFPGIGVIQAHGRMQRGGAEDNVAAFAEGNYQILLATTVIENGVDIPSVNTIIVQNSQAFGMSTLYQLRGRVGRSDLQAYAYFLHREESVTEQAAMRLQAIGELQELGSGFDVANRDLEIRGAGSLLGTEQSGMAAKVGFDLYMRMLKKSIRQLRGLDLPLVPRTNVLLPNGEGSIKLVEDFRIPESFIADAEERQKQETAARLAESTSSLVSITNAWKDAYGPLPGELQEKLKVMHLHACTRRLGIDLVGLVKVDEGIQCVLRSPGLRPRHWGTIVPLLPKGIPTRGLNVCFPARFTLSGEIEQIVGGKRLDLQALLTDESLDDDDQDWDALDQEEAEAMKAVMSAFSMKRFNKADVEQYPRFIVPNLPQKSGAIVDYLLKVLLPAAKVVYEKQEGDKEKAKIAAEIRQKRELLRVRSKENETLENQRLGYRY